MPERAIKVIRLGFCENISGMPEIPTYCLYIDIKLMICHPIPDVPGLQQ